MNLHDVNEAINLLIKHNSKIPLCVWGDAGIGKTQNICLFAKKSGFGVTLTPVAQIQETGDLLGMPIIINRERKIPRLKDGNPVLNENRLPIMDTINLSITTYARPEFLPPEKLDKPHVWVLDDLNRANNLVLQSFLHLLQFREFGPHKLHRDTIIVLTANPENSEYQVRELDNALKSRMLNMDVLFDEVIWATWAQTNSKISQNAINFVLKFKENISNEYNIRAWTNGFETNDSELGMILAVGQPNYMIYRKYIDEYGVLLADFNISDIWENQDKFIKNFTKKVKGEDGERSDFHLLIMKRMAAINLDLLDENKIEKVASMLLRLHTEKIANADALQLPAQTWRKFYPTAFQKYPKAWMVCMEKKFIR